jgi:predicted small metal-binding protein
MNIDFDFDTLYKNERKSLKEIFDTISQHIKTEDIINKLTENEKYYIKLHIANNKEIMGEFVNSRWMNIGGLFTLFMMSAAAISLVILYIF